VTARDVRLLHPDGGQQLVGCSRLGDDLEAGFGEQPRDPFEQ
jgi:hypothetical protein